MVKQYPYQLWVWQTTEATRNGDGHYVAGSSGWVLHSVCRDEVNGGGSTVNLEDGTAYRYESLIQLPKSGLLVYAGTKIEVRDGSVVRLSGTVKRSVAGQLHKRLWV